MKSLYSDKFQYIIHIQTLEKELKQKLNVMWRIESMENVATQSIDSHKEAQVYLKEINLMDTKQQQEVKWSERTVNWNKILVAKYKLGAFDLV